MSKHSHQVSATIELMIAVLVAGIIAYIITLSIHAAHVKSIDKTISADFSASYTQANAYYQGKADTYLFVCSTATTAAPVGGINTLLSDAAKQNNTVLVTALTSAGTPDTTVCHDSATGWAAATPTESVPGYWCIDSTGKAEQTMSVLASGAATCP